MRPVRRGGGRVGIAVRGDTAGASHSGFSLMEIMVSLVVLGLMAAAAVPAIGVFLADEPAADETVAGLLRSARSLALESGQSTTVTIDTRTGRWLVEGDDQPPREGVVKLEGGRLGETLLNEFSPSVVIRFAPTGGGVGGPVVVELPDRTGVVRVDRWTGEVSLHDG